MAEMLRFTVQGSSPVQQTGLDDRRFYLDTWERREITRTANVDAVSSRTRQYFMGSQSESLRIGGVYEVSAGQAGLDPLADLRGYRAAGTRLTLSGTLLLIPTAAAWLVKDVTLRAERGGGFLQGRPKFVRWSISLETAD